MDLPKLKDMEKYHKMNPPVHISVARYLGYGDKQSDAKAPTESDIEQMMMLYPQCPV